MRHLASLILLWPLLATAQTYPNTGNFGVEADRSEPWYQQCLAVKDATPSTAPSGMEMPFTHKTGDCDAMGAYYEKLDQAATSGAEWAGVRRCALASNDTAVLAMLYANGLGVPRDTRIAMHYACRTGAANAEMAQRVGHLADLPPGKRYDHCDDITSGMMGGICANIAAIRAERIRSAYLARLRTSLAAPQTAAFDRLVKASDAFAKAHAEQETPRGGSGYTGFVIDAQAREQEWLREHVLNFEKGRFNVPPASQFPADDAQLNRVYQRRTHPAETPDEFDAQPEQIRATQRLWLVYRDAWVAFAALRYPQLPADSLKALLTQWRIKQL